MRISFLKLLAPALVCQIFSGCGGSSGSTGGGGGGNPTTVTFTFSGVTPTAVATQVGSGSFSAATISSNAVTISVPSGTSGFGMAWVCPALDYGNVTNEYVFESTIADGVSYTPWCPVASPSSQTGTLTMTVDASAFGGDNMQVGAQNGINFAEVNPPLLDFTNYEFAAPTGSDQVDLYLYQLTYSGPEAFLGLAAAKSFSGVAVPGSLNGGNKVTFTSEDSVVNEPITYNNVPQGYSTPSSYVSVLPAGEQFPYLSNQNATSNYQALPAAIAKPGDQYVLVAGAFSNLSPTAGIDSWYTWVYDDITGASAASIAFPAPWTISAPTPAALPTFQANYSGFSGQSGVAEMGLIEWIPESSSSSQYFYTVTASKNYLNGAGSLKFPDVSSLEGFPSDPPSGTTIDWTFQAYQSSSGVLIGQLPANPSEDGVLPANTIINLVGASGDYHVP